MKLIFIAYIENNLSKANSCMFFKSKLYGKLLTRLLYNKWDLDPMQIAIARAIAPYNTPKSNTKIFNIYFFTFNLLNPMAEIKS